MLASVCVFLYPCSMDNKEASAFIINTLGKGESLDNITMALCEKYNPTWHVAETLVKCRMCGLIYSGKRTCRILDLGKLIFRKASVSAIA